jgi:hypothetical protein
VRVAGGKREARRHRITKIVIGAAPAGAEDVVSSAPTRAVNGLHSEPVAARFALATGYPLWRLRRPIVAATFFGAVACREERSVERGPQDDKFFPRINA